METDSAMERLQSLQRDLIAFSESRLPTVDRLFSQLDASLGELRGLLDKKGRSDGSRKIVDPSTTPKSDTLTFDEEEYQVTEEFRQGALLVADELDLDELEAAQLCIQAEAAGGQPDFNMPYKALVRFHGYRSDVLNCVRLLLIQASEPDGEDQQQSRFQAAVRQVVHGGDDKPGSGSAYWRKCADGLTEVENMLKKVEDHKTTVGLTSEALPDAMQEALAAQRFLLVSQHENLAAVMSHLIRGQHTAPMDFRSLLSKAAALEQASDIAIHYLPIITSGSMVFGAEETTTMDAAKDLNRLFAPGPAQLQWKVPGLQGAAAIFWVAEYSSRFADSTKDPNLRVADRQKAEDERSQVFLEGLKHGALHFLLSACQHLKPEVWHNPAKVGLVRYLLNGGKREMETVASPQFAHLVMCELQGFCEAFIANMPNAVRRLKDDDDNRRRQHFASPEASPEIELHFERFLVIMAYAVQDQPDVAEDFWSDREGNLYGFLRWTSTRLPTPRAAAFCELLRAVVSDEKSGNHAHRFLLEDTAVAPGKFRKSHSVSWSQIFSELEVYASSVKNRPVPAPQLSGRGDSHAEGEYIENETEIMLETYMRLASHICEASPDARNWILREQSFHLGETLFHLAASGELPRVHANCFELLAALLTDKVPEVNDGMWVLLDNWISSGGQAGSAPSRLHPSQARSSERHYLQNYANNFETSTGLVKLLLALVQMPQADLIHDTLPFPENLGAPNRHAGIDAYVDFVLGTVFRSTNPSTIPQGQDTVPVDVLRCVCLEFICRCLNTFNEDLAALASTANVAVDSLVHTSSLAAYMRLHPFARVMDWMLNNNIISTLMACVDRKACMSDGLAPGSPVVRATASGLHAVNLAMKLQATYFDIVRPLVNAQPATGRVQSNANSAFASYDDVVLSQMHVVSSVASYMSSEHEELSLAAIKLMQKLCASRKLADKGAYGQADKMRLGSRLVSQLAPICDVVGIELQPLFDIFPWDLDNNAQPPKLRRADALLEMLNNSLDTSAGRPCAAHCLLGFACQSRSVSIEAESAFSQASSLFHKISGYAAQSPQARDDYNVSWLLSVKRGCYELVMKLATSPLTSSIVLPELQAMDFLAASSQDQLLAAANFLWDEIAIHDPKLLVESSAFAVRDFMRVRELFFEYAALELRTANEARAFSIQEKVNSALLGVVRLPSGEEVPTHSVFDLFDFYDLQTEGPPDATFKIFNDFELSACIKRDPELTGTYDERMAELLLILRKRSLLSTGTINHTQDEAASDEMRAILAVLRGQNNFQAIVNARISSLESWTDLLSLMATTDGLETNDLAAVALHGLQVILPRFEKALPGNLDSAALFAKLTLTLVPAAISGSSEQRTITLAQERLTSAFRVCLKAIIDSGTDLTLRDVCYRTCCSVLSSLPLTVVNGKQSPSQNARQLLLLVQNAGDRLVAVITEDAFSGRGVTRVSSLLFLDGLVALHQLTKAMPSMLRALMKLNFVPVLIDQSISNVATSFQAEDDELATNVAYFHTSLSLLLHLCQTPEGTQLVLTSGFFEGIADSRLFSTDPDIGLDIDNPAALKEFYRLLSAVLRVITALVLARGPNNAAVLQQANNFLQQNRFSMQAVFKRTSALQKTAGPPEKEAVDVADEFGRLVFVTGFLEEDEGAPLRGLRANGFT